MPVTLEEYAKVVDAEGIEREGKAVGQHFVAVQDGDTIYYGQLKAVTKVHTTVTCDNDKCEQAFVGDDFKTSPFKLEFDDSGDGSIDLARKLADLVVVSNYRGEKMCFCSPECSAAYFRRVNKEKIVDISTGKGTKTPFLDEVVNGRPNV